MISLLRLIAALAAIVLAWPAAALDEALLQQRIAALGREVGKGALGVGVLDLRTGERWLHNGNRPFPMQSVYKAPIGVAVLREVDRGRLKLDQEVTIRREDLSVPLSPINREFSGESRAYTVRRLLELMVSLSDNTAADVLMRLAGGPAAVTALLKEAGIEGMRIDRYERELQPQTLGLGPFQPEWTDYAALSAASARLPEAQKRKALEAALADPRDSATPAASLDFLAKLQAGRLLSPASTDLLLQIMRGSPTGPARLKAGLPKGSALAHKTGTSATSLGINMATNDIGLATLPDGRVVAIAAYLSGSEKPAASRERILAEAARAAVDALR
jgi:beta-lactamase class A